MRLPGPFHIDKVLEHEWPGQAPDFVLRSVTTDLFRQTRAGQDPAFSKPETGELLMSFHSLVVRTPRGTLLVDGCVGNDKNHPLVPGWHQQNWPYLDRLSAVGLTPADIDYVCCTHLHGDHVGWNARLDGDRWVPTFPNARYLMAAGELKYWENYHEVAPGNPYLRPWTESVLPVIEAGQVERVDYEHEILPGVALQHAPGHTPGNVVIEVDDDTDRAVLSGDVLHHPVQVERPDWCSQFDIDPYQALETRMALLEQLAESGAVMLGAHFTGPSALRIRRDGNGFSYDHAVCD